METFINRLPDSQVWNLEKKEDPFRIRPTDSVSFVGSGKVEAFIIRLPDSQVRDLGRWTHL